MGSGTRNARAASAVVSPPSVRKRERHLRGRLERRVTTREHEPEPLVGDRHVLVSIPTVGPVVDLVVGCGVEQHLGGVMLLVAPAFSAQPIDRLAPRGRRDPGRGVLGRAVLGPVLERDDHRVLECLFREVEVVQGPDQSGQHEPRLLAKDSLDGGRRALHGFQSYDGRLMIGRISIDPIVAPGMRAAISMAASRSSHSTR